MAKGDKAADKAQAEAEKVIAKEEELGYRGTKVDPLPNEDYSLESGPDGPTAAEARAALDEATLAAA